MCVCVCVCVQRNALRQNSNLANNEIEHIGAHAFGPNSAQLLSLDLKANPVRRLSANAFVALIKLKTL